MKTNKDDHILIRWFYKLPEFERYRHSSQWMEDEAKGISIPKLADLLVNDKRTSDALVKSFRSFDLKLGQLKTVWRPRDGYSTTDVHLICNAVNLYREKNHQSDRVSAEAFYQRAWAELQDRYPLEPVAELEPEPAAEPEPEPTAEPEPTTEPEPTAEPPTPIVHSADKARQSLTASQMRMTVVASVVVLGVMMALMSLKQPEQPSLANPPPYQPYLPGNVVQLRLQSPDGQRQMLAQPEHYLSAAQCYPQLEPEVSASDMVLNHQLQALPMTDLDHYTRLLPSLPSNDGVLQSSSLVFDDLQRWHMSKGMINLGMTATCLASMQQVIDYGNLIEDYGIIKQAYVASGIQIELVFGKDASPAQIKQLTDPLVDYFIGAKVTVASDSIEQGNRVRLTISGPITVGYISQQMSALLIK